MFIETFSLVTYFLLIIRFSFSVSEKQFLTFRNHVRDFLFDEDFVKVDFAKWNHDAKSLQNNQNYRHNNVTPSLKWVIRSSDAKAILDIEQG